MALRDGVQTLFRAGGAALVLARPMLAVHLAFVALNAVLLVPAFGAALRLAIGLSGGPALADVEIALALLRPIGAIAGIMLAGLAVCLQALELAAMMTVAVRASKGQPLSMAAVGRTLVHRALPILATAIVLVVRLLILAAPFLIVAAGLALTLLGEHDINWYLDERPPAFLAAVGSIGLVAVAMIAVLAVALVRWSLVLPLVLFRHAGPIRAFAESARATRPRRRVVAALGVWVAVSFGLGLVITATTALAAGLLARLADSSLTLVALVLGGAFAGWLVLNFFVTAATSALLALTLAELAGVAGLSAVARPPHPAVGPSRRVAVVAVPIVAMVASVGVGLGLLHGTAVEDDVAVIGHRGGSTTAPENSLAAIRDGVQAGADWIEIDVQETADGAVVVLHDRDFMKVAGDPLAVHAATLSDIGRIDIGSRIGADFAGTHAPTLSEALEAVRGRAGLLIELKYYGFQQRLEERVAETVEQAGMADDVAVMSLESTGLARMQALRPDWRAGLLAATAVGDLTALPVDFIAVRSALVDRPLMRRAEAAGKTVYAWTVNDPLAMSRLISLGVDGLITDDPVLARDVLEARAEMGLATRLLLHAAALVGYRTGRTNPAEDQP